MISDAKAKGFSNRTIGRCLEKTTCKSFQESSHHPHDHLHHHCNCSRLSSIIYVSLIMKIKIVADSHVHHHLHHIYEHTVSGKNNLSKLLAEQYVFLFLQQLHNGGRILYVTRFAYLVACIWILQFSFLGNMCQIVFTSIHSLAE